MINFYNKMKTRKQLKKELIEVINGSKITDYIISYQNNKITIKIEQGKMKKYKMEITEFQAEEELKQEGGK